MPTRSSTPALTIGFFGTGAMDVEHGTTLIEEFIDGKVTEQDKVRWVFVLTSDEFTQTLADYAAQAKEFDIAYEVITKPEDRARRTFVEVANDAAHQYNIENPLLQLEQILKEAPQAALFMLWDEERNDEMERISSQFLDDEIDVYELSDALTPLGWDDSEATEATVTNIRPAEAEQEDTEEGAEAGEEGIYSRTDLKEMSMVRLKEVGATLGLPPKKSREVMVNDILAAQGGAEEAAEETEPEPVREPAVVGVTMEALGITEGIEEVLDRFSNTFVARMSDVFDSFLTDLGKTIEGIQFNMTPEPQAPVVEVVVEEPEQPRRRLRRG